MVAVTVRAKVIVAIARAATIDNHRGDRIEGEVGVPILPYVGRNVICEECLLIFF